MRVTPASASTLRARALASRDARVARRVFRRARLDPASCGCAARRQRGRDPHGRRRGRLPERRGGLLLHRVHSPGPVPVPGVRGAPRRDRRDGDGQDGAVHPRGGWRARVLHSCVLRSCSASSHQPSTTSRSSWRTRNASTGTPSSSPSSPPPSARTRSRCTSASSRFLGAKRTPRTRVVHRAPAVLRLLRQRAHVLQRRSHVRRHRVRQSRHARSRRTPEAGRDVRVRRGEAGEGGGECDPGGDGGDGCRGRSTMTSTCAAR